MMSKASRTINSQIGRTPQPAVSNGGIPPKDGSSKTRTVIPPRRRGGRLTKDSPMSFDPVTANRLRLIEMFVCKEDVSIREKLRRWAKEMVQKIQNFGHTHVIKINGQYVSIHTKIRTELAVIKAFVAVIKSRLTTLEV